MQIPIPKRAFFNFSAPCYYREKAPVLDGKLDDWDKTYRVPDLNGVEGKGTFIDLYMAWNKGGLYFALEVQGASRLDVQPRRPQRSDGLQLWVDTRDVRNAHRASRYCHHFCFVPIGSGRGGKQAFGRQFRIRRARAQARLCDSDRLGVVSHIPKSGYQMEIHLPGEVLTGFDPEENNRLGFTYMLRDRKLGRVHWTGDDSVPVSYDPSLWGTVELVK